MKFTLYCWSLSLCFSSVIYVCRLCVSVVCMALVYNAAAADCHDSHSDVRWRIASSRTTQLVRSGGHVSETRVQYERDKSTCQLVLYRSVFCWHYRRRCTSVPSRRTHRVVRTPSQHSHKYDHVRNVTYRYDIHVHVLDTSPHPRYDLTIKGYYVLINTHSGGPDPPVGTPKCGTDPDWSKTPSWCHVLSIIVPDGTLWCARPVLSYAFRMSYRTGRSVSHYDLHIASVTVDDDGVYTCVDKAGMGQTASASLSVLPRRSTQRRQITVSSSLTTSSLTSHSRFSTQQQGNVPPPITWLRCSFMRLLFAASWLAGALRVD